MLIAYFGPPSKMKISARAVREPPLQLAATFKTTMAGDATKFPGGVRRGAIYDVGKGVKNQALTDR